MRKDVITPTFTPASFFDLIFILVGVLYCQKKRTVQGPFGGYLGNSLTVEAK